MKKRSLIYIVLLVFVFFIVDVNAAVFINEIEVNPPGNDPGNEWIEVYNDGLPLSLDRWYAQDKNGKNYTFPATIITNFYVLDNLSGLTNTNQTLKLYDNNGLLRDNFIGFYDEENDERTWSRMPDGSGNFIFQEQTKGIPNKPLEISNKNSSPSCITSGTNVILTVDVSGICAESVIFSAFLNGEWRNFTGEKLPGNSYKAVINSSFLPSSQNVDWTVFAIDCFNTTVQDGAASFYVNSKTTLEITPTNPDGLHSWYISVPMFSLINIDAGNIFYQWDSEAIINYLGTFGLEDASNNANVTGGILELNYWSDVCDEQHYRKVIKTDFSNPEIKNLQPADNSVVINNPRPTISALLDEIYQSNSGIDENKVYMFLDNLEVNPRIQSIGSLDAEVSFTQNIDLDEGMHEVRVDFSDNAGRQFSKIWKFNITLNVRIDFNVDSPISKLYSNKKIPFNISASEELEKIEYINYNENSHRFRILCRNCEEYGFSRERERTLLEGENNITIKGTSKFGQAMEKNVLLFIESKQPKILKTFPIKGFTNGRFSIEFQEENPENLTLNYGNSGTGVRVKSLNLESCETGRRKTLCETMVDLLDYDEQEINYNFVVRDIANNSATSRTRALLVDVTPPIINEFGYTIDERKVEFMLNVSESNFRKVFYIDNTEATPRTRTICIKLNENICKRKASFSVGEHNLTINIKDKAGNTEMIENVVFGIV